MADRGQPSPSATDIGYVVVSLRKDGSIGSPQTPILNYRNAHRELRSWLRSNVGTKWEGRFRVAIVKAVLR